MIVVSSYERIKANEPIRIIRKIPTDNKPRKLDKPPKKPHQSSIDLIETPPSDKKSRKCKHIPDKPQTKKAEKTEKPNLTSTLQPPESGPHDLKYSVEIVERLLYLVNEKKMKVSAASVVLGIPSRKAYYWIKIYQKTNPSQFSERYVAPYTHQEDKYLWVWREHIDFIRSLYDAQPNSTVSYAEHKFRQQFPTISVSSDTLRRIIHKNLNITLSGTYSYTCKRKTQETLDRRYAWGCQYKASAMDFEKNCVFIGEAVFNTKPSADDESSENKNRVCHNYLVAISASRVIHLQKSGTFGSKSNHNPDERHGSLFLNERYFVEFVEETLKVLDKSSDRPIYIVLPHRVTLPIPITEAIRAALYQPEFIPDYSDELNPVKYFWEILRNKICNIKSRKGIGSIEELMSIALSRIKPSHCAEVVKKSLSRVNDCVSKTHF